MLAVRPFTAPGRPCYIPWDRRAAAVDLQRYHSWWYSWLEDSVVWSGPRSDRRRRDDRHAKFYDHGTPRMSRPSTRRWPARCWFCGAAQDLAREPIVILVREPIVIKPVGGEVELRMVARCWNRRACATRVAPERREDFERNRGRLPTAGE